MRGKQITQLDRDTIIRLFNDHWSVLAIAQETGFDRGAVTRVIESAKKPDGNQRRSLRHHAPRSAHQVCRNGHGLVQMPCLACEMQLQKRIERLTGKVEPKFTGPLEIPLADIGLDVEIVELLDRRGYVYVGDLQGVEAEALAAIPMMGGKRIAALTAALRRVLA